MNTIERTRSLVLGLSVVALSIVAAAGCGGEDESNDVGGDGDKEAGSSVAVTLNEFEILTDKDSVPAGNVTFRAKNIGPDDSHELVVVKTDLAPDKLPTSTNGAALYRSGVELIGEIEEFAVGGEEEMTFDLEPGKYVLLCNVMHEEEDGTLESRYKEGQHTAFTVE